MAKKTAKHKAKAGAKDNARIKDDIMAVLVPDVPFDGWRWETVAAAAEKAGYGRAMAAAVFPGRMNDVLGHFALWLDDKMMAALEGVDTEEMRVRDRIHVAVMARIAAMQEAREAERLALAYWAVPTRGFAAGKIVWRTADRIWSWAGDTATDYNRCTKRGLLSGVLGATAMAWLNDDSGELAATEAFLARRIENVMQFGRILGKIKKAS